MNMSSPVTSLFEMERVKENECLFAASVLMFCYNIAWTISTTIGGWMIERYSFQATFMMASFFYLMAAGCYWLFFSHERRPKIEAPAAKEEIPLRPTA